jgi:soluble lytic murein transglycosylase
MQIVAPTAREIASALGEPSTPDLTDPGLSFRFGAHYLASQLRRFEGDILMALAAYNGGPENAEAWEEERELEGADGYLYAIEFDEPREYIERVLVNYARYRGLYVGAPEGTIR